MFYKLLKLVILWLCVTSVYAAGPLRIVAAENFYGQMAEQIGGPYVTVQSIMRNPQQDPHLFSSSPAIAKSIADAHLIIYNGLDYDPWVKNLIAAAHPKTQHVIVVADLRGKVAGDNPHIWYDPKTMLIYAEYLTTQLSQMDAAHQAYFHQQQDIFKHSAQTLQSKILQMHQQFQGTPVIATEPVFNEMATILGLVMQGQGFQRSIMNDTEPSMSDRRDFENQLQQHQVKILIYNNQVTNPVTEKMQQLAQKVSIPVVGVSELEPPDQDYVTWMNQELDKLANALH